MISVLSAWPLIAAVILVAVGVAIILLALRSRLDRKRQLARGKPDNPWSGSGASTVTAIFRGTADAARTASTQAIRHLGGQDISLNGSSVITGWIGSMWTNIPQWQAYQLSVVIEDEEANPLHLLCCARPRKAWAASLCWTWWYVWGGNGSDELAQRLSQEIIRLTLV
jgi:hypothetical protein